LAELSQRVQQPNALPLRLLIAGEQFVENFTRLDRDQSAHRVTIIVCRYFVRGHSINQLARQEPGNRLSFVVGQ